MHCSTFGAAQDCDENRTEWTDLHTRMEETSKIYRGSKIQYSFDMQKFHQIMVVVLS